MPKIPVRSEDGRIELSHLVVRRLPKGQPPKAAAVTQFSVQRHCRLSTFPKANHHGYRYRHSELNCDKRKKAFETNGSVLVFSFFITLPLIWSDCMDATIVFDLNEREHSNMCHMNWLLDSEKLGERMNNQTHT